MASTKDLENYLTDVAAQFASKEAGEHAYRPALYQLMRCFDDVEAINDPKRSAFGAPDFVFQKASNRDIILGYAEAKDVGEPLDKVEQSDQMRRYAGYRNLFLTDYLEFRFYVDGVQYDSVRVGQVVDGSIRPLPEKYTELIAALQKFLGHAPQPIASGRRLAEIMGAKARRVREDVREYFESGPPDNQDLVKMLQLMRHYLVHDLDKDRFADMYSQTLVYGLFIARYNDPSPESFSRNEARTLVPKTNPFLRTFFDHIVGPNFDERLARAVDELCEVFQVSDVATLVQRHLTGSGSSETRDPIIHFYEDFLQSYDADLRRQMGAYYTPLPVVRFIVRKTDELLRSEFGIAKGLADSSRIRYRVEDQQTRKYKDRSTGRYKTTVGQELEVHRVQILDPAVGTATFLNEVINFIYATSFQGSQEGRWPSYSEEDLVPRLNGFEYMMAPYTIAHLKLGMTLADTGVSNMKNRLRVYLTNALEEGVPQQPDLFSFGLTEVVTEESREAAVIKAERPIMVVIGNPPYFAQSSNDTDYANGLVAQYKFEPGGTSKLAERKHWLNDDYLKFIALAQNLVARTGEGIVAMITAHGYLHNKTSRGVRWKLAQTFDKIYALDLHGNVKMKEVAGGVKDENVFNIQQGVSILLAVKQRDSPAGDAEVYAADLFGTREEKYRALDEDDVTWERIELNRPSMRFARSPEIAGRDLYEGWPSLNNLFLVSNTSLVTARDKVVVDKDRGILRRRIERFGDSSLSDDEVRSWLFANRRASRRGYAPGDTRGWKLPDARVAVRKENLDENLQEVSYRPFDKRWIYYSASMVDWRRVDVMKHMVLGSNYGLVFRRQSPERQGSSYFFISDSMISDGFIKSDNKGSESLAPLYLYHDEGQRTSNLRKEVAALLIESVEGAVTDEELFDYIYGVVFSKAYRDAFVDLIRDDFPRIPPAGDREEFEVFRDAGERLRCLHLMSAPDQDVFSTTYPVAGTNEVGRARRDDQSRVWINSKQYFGNVKESAWTFSIGAYCPLQKWLDVRKGDTLSGEDLDHYQQMVSAIEGTMDIQTQLEQYVPSWLE